MQSIQHAEGARNEKLQMSIRCNKQRLRIKFTERISVTGWSDPLSSKAEEDWRTLGELTVRFRICRKVQISQSYNNKSKSHLKNSVAWVRERTIPTELPPLVGEVSANFCLYRVPHGQLDGSLRPYLPLSRSEPLLFLQSSSSIALTRLSAPRSRLTTSQKIW
jgi:hypothetical protein